MNFNKVEFERSFGLSAQLPDSTGLEFVFAGRSNAGKSSLLNKIFNRKSLARVSSMPGKTATINFYRCENIRLVDLPGYGYAKVAHGERRRWDELIGGYFGQSRDIALVFLLMDMRHSPSKDDLTMANYLIDSEMPFIIILTKADKLSKKQREERIEAFKTELPCGEDITMIPFSSVTGEGAEEVCGIISDISEPEDDQESEEQSIIIE
ncbi:MAG: YihA family ribosome biogenesis GTP-binding protein [Oscillospiraceae bacterium]|nr:YihA family ribosome biogenesis GTP-binding protein [Oscillospiraceae bacterium]